MSRNQVLVRVLACSLVVVWSAAALAQVPPGDDQKPKKESPEKSRPELKNPQDAQKGSHTSKIDQMWREIGQLHKQIVELEVADMNPRATSGDPTPFPAPPSLPERSSKKKPEARSEEPQKPEQSQKTRPGQDRPSETRGGPNAVKIDQLWRQITEKQKEICRLEVAAARSGGLPGPKASTDGVGRIETLASNSPNLTEDPAGDGQKEEEQQTRPAQDRPGETRGGFNDSRILKLWQEIGERHRQIVGFVVGDSAGSRKSPTSESPRDAERPKPEKKPIEQ